MRDETRQQLHRHLENLQRARSATEREDEAEMHSSEEFKRQCAQVLDSVVDPSFGEIAEIYREYGLAGIIEHGTTPRGTHSTLRLGPDGRSGYLRVECDEERWMIKIIRSFNHVAGGLAEQVGEYSPEGLTREVLDAQVEEFVSELVR